MDNRKLRIEHVSKRYGDEVAVQSLDLSVKSGDFKSLLGPSGCGKTTTLRCIAGLERPDEGEIYIDDQLVSAPEKGIHLSPQDRNIGMVFQMHSLWPHMTVRENLLFPLRHQNIGTKQERNDKVEEMLKLVHLEGYIDELTTNLSGGQQQRVALSRALITEPKLLLLDEPLSSLDEKLRLEMRSELQRINKELETTMLYVTHSQEEALYMSDEIALMHDGKILEEGNPETIYYEPTTFFGMNFVGNVNVLKGRVESMNGDVVSVESDIGTIRSTDVIDDIDPGDEVSVCFRPNVCTIHPLGQSPPDPEDGSVFEGRLNDTGLDQKIIEYRADVKGNQLIIHSTKRVPVENGDSINIHLHSADVKLFYAGDAPPGLE